jgi:hypothetical protein
MLYPLSPDDKVQALQSVGKQFGVENSGIDREEFLGLLSGIIEKMISKDMHKLMQLLYRVDVNEDKLRKALSEQGPEAAPLIIANLILERQEEKIYFRNKYKNS